MWQACKPLMIRQCHARSRWLSIYRWYPSVPGARLLFAYLHYVSFKFKLCIVANSDLILECLWYACNTKVHNSQDPRVKKAGCPTKVKETEEERGLLIQFCLRMPVIVCTLEG